MENKGLDLNVHAGKISDQALVSRWGRNFHFIDPIVDSLVR